MGVQGIQVPHISDARAAREAVQAVRYAPLGDRGMAGASRASDYGKISIKDHMEQSNREITLAVMIEDLPAVDQIDAIAATEGSTSWRWGPPTCRARWAWGHRRSSEAGRGHRAGRRGRAQGRGGPAGPAHEPPDPAAHGRAAQGPRGRLHQLRAGARGTNAEVDAGAGGGGPRAASVTARATRFLGDGDGPVTVPAREGSGIEHTARRGIEEERGDAAPPRIPPRWRPHPRRPRSAQVADAGRDLLHQQAQALVVPARVVGIRGDRQERAEAAALLVELGIFSAHSDGSPTIHTLSIR